MKFKLDISQTVLITETLSSIIIGVHGVCKTTPSSSSWPSVSEWADFNKTLSGALIQPVPPGAPCHPGQSSYNNDTCSAVQKAWTTSWTLYESDPVGQAYNNWNNDTCLPYPEAPCSGEGYPAYVVNATTADLVSKTVDFAREKDIRLNVKGTGHDFLGRSVAPNALSIWTRHMKGITVHDGFKVSGHHCLKRYDGPALTLAAGTVHGEAFAEANKHGLMVHVGGGPTVGVGGYFTGGGHSILSSQYGMAADAVLEMTVVTPDGKIRTVNECSEPDLFWAMRGGGGATFGIIVNITERAWPSVPITTRTLIMSPLSNDTAPLWDSVAHIASQMPGLADSGLMSYSFNSPPSDTDNSTAAFIGIFIGVNMTATAAGALLDPLEKWINTTHPTGVHTSLNVTDYPSLYEYWATNPDTTTPLGLDLFVGSRLFDAKALSSPNFVEAMEAAGYPSLYLVSGPGVHNKSASFNAVNPAWRRSYVHSTTGAVWAPFNTTQKREQEYELTHVKLAAMRKLAPDTGCYINEAYPFEPNFQHTFWGENYPRLLSIKRRIDPGDVLWCRACVGNERWQEVGDQLCQVVD